MLNFIFYLWVGSPVVLVAWFIQAYYYKFHCILQRNAWNLISCDLAHLTQIFMFTPNRNCVSSCWHQDPLGGPQNSMTLGGQVWQNSRRLGCKTEASLGPTCCAQFLHKYWLYLGFLSLMCINMAFPWYSKMTSQTNNRKNLFFFQIKEEVSDVPYPSFLSLLLLCKVALFIRNYFIKSDR